MLTFFRMYLASIGFWLGIMVMMLPAGAFSLFVSRHAASLFGLGHWAEDAVKGVSFFGSLIVSYLIASWVWDRYDNWRMLRSLRMK